MKIKNLKFVFATSMLACFTSIFLLSCMGCGGVKKGDKSINGKSSTNTIVENTEENAGEIEIADSGNSLHKEQNPVPNEEIKKRKKHYKFNESKARKDAETRYPEHKIRGTLRGDSIMYIWADNKASHSLEYLVTYNYNGDFLENTDLTNLNPYKEYIDYNRVEGTYHQMLGNNVVVNGTKEKIKGNIPQLLYDLTPDDFFISATNPYIVTEPSPDKSKILIRFGFHLLPSEEILEHQTYPGINTYVILDVNTGKEINRIEDLLFIPYSETLTKDGKYLIVSHTQDMKEGSYSTNEEDWKHQASIYSAENGELCFRKEGKNECSYLHRTINGLTEIFISGFECYDQYYNQDTIKHYFIKDNAIIVRNVSLKEGNVSKYSTKEYEAIKTIDGKIIKYYYDTDYKKIKTLCK